MKAYGGADVQIHVFLTLSIVRNECSASLSGRFNPTVHVGVQVGWAPEPALIDLEEGSSYSFRDSNPYPSSEL
jgi:hypothetical protein